MGVFQHKNQDNSLYLDEDQTLSSEFELFAIVIHQGKGELGHYYAYIIKQDRVVLIDDIQIKFLDLGVLEGLQNLENSPEEKFVYSLHYLNKDCVYLNKINEENKIKSHLLDQVYSENANFLIEYYQILF